MSVPSSWPICGDADIDEVDYAIFLRWNQQFFEKEMEFA